MMSHKKLILHFVARIVCKAFNLLALNKNECNKSSQNYKFKKKKKKNFDRFGGDIFWLLYNKSNINDKSCECD